MKKNVEREMEDLEKMVKNWKADYSKSVTPNGPNDYLLDDLIEEIGIYIGPYMTRLIACKHLTREEAGEWMNKYNKYVSELKEEIDEAEKYMGT